MAGQVNSWDLWETRNRLREAGIKAQVYSAYGKIQMRIRHSLADSQRIRRMIGGGGFWQVVATGVPHDITDTWFSKQKHVADREARVTESLEA